MSLVLTSLSSRSSLESRNAGVALLGKPIRVRQMAILHLMKLGNIKSEAVLPIMRCLKALKGHVGH